MADPAPDHHQHVTDDDLDSTHSNLGHEQDSSSYHSSDDEPPHDSDDDYEYEYHPASDDPVSHLVILDMTSRVKRHQRRNPPPPSPPPPPRKRRTNRQRQGLDPTTDDDDDDANDQDDQDDDDEGLDEDDDAPDENDVSNDSEQSSPPEQSPPQEHSPPSEPSPPPEQSPFPEQRRARAISALLNDGDDEDDFDGREELQRRRNALQLLDLATPQPLVSDHRRIYALTWARALGTELLFSVPNTAEGETYRPQFLGTTRVRLLAHPLRPRPRVPSPEAEDAQSRSIWARRQAELAVNGELLFDDLDADLDADTDTDTDTGTGTDTNADADADTDADMEDADDSSDQDVESSTYDYFGSASDDTYFSASESPSSTRLAADGSDPLTSGAPNSEPTSQDDQPTGPDAAEPTMPQGSLKRKRPHSPSEPATYSPKKPRTTAPIPLLAINSAIISEARREPARYRPEAAEATAHGSNQYEGRGLQLAMERRDTLFGEFTNGDAPSRPHGVPRRLCTDSGDGDEGDEVQGEAGDEYGGRGVSPELVTALEEGAGFADPDSDEEAVMSGGLGVV